MEAKNSKSAKLLVDCNLPDMSANNTENMTSKSNPTDTREATKTMLEDVCTDFECMDVISSKNKACAVKKGLTNPLSPNNIDQSKNSGTDTVTNKVVSSDKVVVKDISDSYALTTVNEMQMNTSPQSEMNSLLVAPSVSSEVEPLQSSSCAVVLGFEPVMHSNPEILPSNNCQNPTDITMLSESFVDEENIPIAELADAEIVQSGDDVTIIVSNTRLIKVLTNANNTDSSMQSIMDPNSAILETSVDSNQQLGIIDSAVLANSSFQGINIIGNSSEVGESLISDKDDLSTSVIEESELTEDQLNALRKHTNPKGRPIKKALRRYSEMGSTTKARRITAKMKAEWTRQLDATGHLVCEMPGCSQTYVTIANFQTHYKYCTGKKSLQHCLYCDSLIISSHKSVLRHMEVEHPEKVEEYKAQYPEETIEFEGGGLPSHLIVAEDENVAMNVEEVTQPQKNCRKRKLSSKENVVSKKVILKHKMQSIQNTVTENIKEFKKCVRFGDIVDKINSVNASNSFEIPTDTPNKSLKQKKERKKIIFTESIVAEDKYFEDGDEDTEPLRASVEVDDMNSSQMHTKARMLLNMERYKRYKEYLKLTRDWSSERKTYSRSRTSDTSLDDSSILMALQNECLQDTHQLNDAPESSSVSLNTSETEINPNDVSNLEAFQNLDMSHLVSAAPTKPVARVNEPLISIAHTANKSSLTISNECTPEQPDNSFENRTIFEPFIKREKTACYNRPSLSNVQNKNEVSRLKPVKFEGIITYGMTVPGKVSKSAEPPVTFDSLIRSMQQKPIRRNSSDKGADACADVENNPQKQVTKEDDLKQSSNVVCDNLEPPKRKRGRPPKPKSAQLKNICDSKKKIEKNKKYSTAMLKSIEKNVKNRHKKFFGVRKNSKFKSNSKKNNKQSQLHSKKSNLKGIQKKNFKHKLLLENSKRIQKKNFKSRLLAVSNKKFQKNLKRSLVSVNNIISMQEMQSTANTVDESIIQCQENIDNHLPLGNELDNISHIQSLATEHNYSNIINSVIEDQLIADANNVATEIEVITSNEQNAPESFTVESNSKDIGIVIQEGEEFLANNISNSHLEVTETDNVGDTLGSKRDLDHASNKLLLDAQEHCSANNSEIPVSEQINQSEIPPFVHHEVAKKTSTEQSIEMQEICAEILQISKDKMTNMNHEEKQFANSTVITEMSSLDTDRPITVEQLHSCEIDNSEGNQKAESVTPEVKVKRPRGRPRKNTNKMSMPDASNAQSLLQNVSNIGKLDKSQVTDDTPGKQYVAETPDSVNSENRFSAVRKSERVKRRKLVAEIFESPKVEAKKKDVDTTPVIRTGRRGRPRKIQPTDSEINLPDSKTSDVRKTPENESESVDENLRKYSRKGRPRKCVRYADLNSGVDSSESLDGLNSGSCGKDKGELHKIKGDRFKKSPEEKEKNTNIKNSDNFYAQDEGIILPLKKRKQKQTKKDDSSLDYAYNVNTNKDSVDSESMLDEDENAKLAELESEDDDIDSKKEHAAWRKSRGLRNQKNSKVSSSKRKRTRRDSSDLESEFSSYINNRNDKSYTAPVTRQKSSNLEALDLDEETSDIEKNDADVNTQKDSSKILNDISLINRRLSARSIARSKQLGSATMNYSCLSSVTLLPDFKPQKCAWKLLSDKEYHDFLPPMKNSAYFKTETTGCENEANWSSLSLFESAPINKKSCHGTFFTGGPILCAAWCPTPVEDKKVQYVALAISCSMDKYHSYVCTDAEKGLLQLWNVGLLHDKMLDSKPAMELSISHNHGIVTEMAWCPNGCWDDPSIECSDNYLPRLGMLAVACSDSNIRVYSIPHPNFLSKESAFPIYASCPSIVLKPMNGEMCSVTRKSMCISLSWQKSDDCERIAGGYGNGVICIWRINTSATVLASKESNLFTISPYLVFNAHGSPISSVCFAPLPGGRFLVSSSTDKTLKFWDLIDISSPFFTVKKGSARSAEWANHYCGAFASLDHGMNCFKGSSFFKECGTESFPSRLLSNPSCSVVKSTMSEWLNAQAIADMSGSVSVSFTHSLLQEHMKSPQYFHRPVYKTELKLLDSVIEMGLSNNTKSVNCIGAIQEMTDIVSILNRVIDNCSKERNLETHSLNELVNGNAQKSVEVITEQALSSECTESINCLTAVQEMKDIVTLVIEIAGECKRSKQLEDIYLTNKEECHRTQSFEHSENPSIKELFNDEVRENEETIIDKLSEMAEIVKVVTDMKDVTSTVEHLEVSLSESKTSSNSASDVSPETSFMEVDKEFVDNQNLVKEQSSDISPINMKEPADKIKDNPSEILQTLYNSVNILVGETDTPVKVNDTICQDIKTDSQMPVLENELNVNEGAVENIYSESVTCVSTMQEMEDIVSVMDDVTNECDKLDPPGISLEQNKLDVLENIKTKSEVEALLKEAVEKASSLCSSESVYSVIQSLKDVISTVAGLVEKNKKMNMILNSVEMQRTAEIAESIAEYLNKKKLDLHEGTKDKKWIMHERGLPYELSEITDIVGVVMDMRDVTTTMEQLMLISKKHSIQNQVSPFNSQLASMDEPSHTDENFVNNLHSDLSTEVIPEIITEEATLIKNNNLENTHLEVSDILHCIIKTVSEEINAELEVKSLLHKMVSDLQMVHESEESEAQKPSSSSLTAENVLESEFIAVKEETKGKLPHTDVCNELITAKPSTELSISNETGNQCNNYVPITQSFDHEPLELLVEEDEPMLSADGDSSNSENEMDTDDELDGAESYLFDQKSGFSDDSVLSECSLESNISMCSSSGESDMSENSSDSVPGDQELDNAVLYSSNQNNTVVTTKASPESPPSLLSLISEMSQNLPSSRNTDSVALESDSTASNILGTQKSSKLFDDKVVEKMEITSISADGIVPSSSCQDIDILSENNLKVVSEESNKMDSLDISMELHVSSNSPIMPPETLSNVSEDAVSANSSETHVLTSDVLFIDKSCDIIPCSTEISENVDFSYKACTESNTDCIEKTLVEECNSQNITPRTDDKDIFDTEKAPEIVVNSDNDEGNDERRNISIENVIIDNKKTFSPKRFSYENVISQYGLVFKDMNTANFASIDRSMEEIDSLSLDQYHLASVKTIAWNPNYGSHFWLFSAGQSGIARLSYISDINQRKISKAKDGKDAS